MSKITEEIISELGPDGVREIAMRFMLGACIGELVALGATEDEVCEAFDACLQSLRESGRLPKDNGNVQ